MNQKITGNEVYWALAPEYADGIFEKMSGNDGLRLTGTRSCAESEAAAKITNRTGDVAVISINGPIFRDTCVAAWSGEIICLGQDVILKAVQESLANPEVSAILLSFNSPGGVVAGTKELADFIAKAAKEKPLAAYVNGLCASAAFWLASATGRVFTPKTGQSGSIGVIMTIADYSGFYRQMGVKIEYITSGKYKAAGARELTEEEREYFHAKITALHNIFKADIAGNLKIKAPEPEWAEAQIFLGDAALALGLCEKVVQDEEEAIQILKEKIMSKPITMEILKAEAPELLAQIRKEAMQEALIEHESLALTAMKIICRPTQLASCEKMLEKAKELGLSANQLAGVSEILPKADQADSKLGELAQIHPFPLQANPVKNEKTGALLADAERRAAKQESL